MEWKEGSSLKKKKSINNLNWKVVVSLVFFLTVLVVSVFYLLGGKKSSSLSEDQIKIERGDKTVIVNENGIIEYQTSTGTYYDYWDSEKTSSFFSYVRRKAKEYLESPSDVSGDGYYISLFVDGKEVKIWVSSEDEVISEVFDADVNSGDIDLGGSLNDYFEEYFNPSPTPRRVAAPSPTSPPSNPGTVSAQQGGTQPTGGNSEQIPVDCSLYEAAVTGRTVISNSLCVN